MTIAFEEMKREIAYKMTPQEFNQFLLDYVCGNVHGKCMEHCCDEDQSEYEMWSQQRTHLSGLCGVAAGNSLDWVAYVNRFNTHNMPVRVRLMRQRAARGAVEVQL